MDIKGCRKVVFRSQYRKLVCTAVTASVPTCSDCSSTTRCSHILVASSFDGFGGKAEPGETIRNLLGASESSSSDEPIPQSWCWSAFRFPPHPNRFVLFSPQLPALRTTCHSCPETSLFNHITSRYPCTRTREGSLCRGQKRSQRPNVQQPSLSVHG